MRCAIYYIPPREHSLCAAAGTWLRRDPYTGAAISGQVAGLDEEWHATLTAAPRRYGFHATIKAPFRLAEPWTVEDVAASLADFALNAAPFELALRISRIDEFFAYVPVVQLAELDTLAGDVVMAFEPFRAPLNDADLARRSLDRLSPEQRDNVMNWGYPYVFDQFRFHMTLTGAVAPDHVQDVESALYRHFGSADAQVDVSQLVLAVEPIEGAPFIVHSTHGFAATRERKRA
jgi:hypothetical protein